MTHQTITTWTQEMSFKSEVPGGEIIYDADQEIGGNDSGPRPKATMLSALASCTGMDVVSLLKKMRTEVGELKIKVEGELTDNHPKIYKKVLVKYYFKGVNLEKDKIEKAVKLSINKYCGVYEMFKSFAKMSHKIIYNDISE